MDELRFDRLTKTLAAGQSRRIVLKGLVGGVLGALTGLAGRRATAAATPCTSGRQCPSFRCVDGYCCDRACTGQCEACNVPGHEGICSPVTGAPVGNRQACPGHGSCQATCDGQHPNGCAFPASETSCGDATCADGWQTTYGCGGNGSCTPTTTSCGLFVCNPAGTACLTTCAANADCVGAAFCNAQGICQGDQPLGGLCTSADQCQHGHCVDGLCCLEACDGVCQACNLAGTEGFCAQVPDGASCDGGACCDGDCVATSSDVEHCGGCDNACPRAQCDDPVCQAGVCALIPVSGRACDDGDDCTANDHCDNGVCVGAPVDCPECRVCSAGACVPGQNGIDCGDGGSCCAGVCCPALAGCCPDGEGNEVCVDLTAESNCGGCGIQCPASQICSGGGCCIIPGPGSNVACTEDSDCCGDEPVCCGTCVFLSTDERHCGGCGIQCDTAARQICFNGGCCGGAGAACTTDADCCITSCVDGTCESFQ